MMRGSSDAARINGAGTILPLGFFVVGTSLPCNQSRKLFPRVPMMPRSTLRRRAGLTILVAAFLSFLLSVTLWFTGSHEQGLFVGLWVPSILSFGCVALLMSDGRNE